MSRRPTTSPMVDLGADDVVADPTPARSAVLLDVDARQHAAISGYGCPALFTALAIDGALGYLPIRTCGVTQVRLGLLVSGRGTAVVTTAEDATGVTLSWGTVAGASAAVWVWTRGTDPLTVRASAARSWAMTEAEVAITAESGWDAVVLGAVVIPLHPAI